jgi:hypothetical protein
VLNSPNTGVKFSLTNRSFYVLKYDLRDRKCLTFASFIFIFIFGRVTRKSNPDGGMEAVGDRSGPWLFLFESHRGTALWLFLFHIRKRGEFKKGDFKRGYLKEGEELIEWGLLGQTDVRRRGGDEKTLRGTKRL